MRSVPVVNLIPLRLEMRMVGPTLPRDGTDLMTLQNELLHTLGKRRGPARTQNGRRDLSVKDSGGRGTDK